jgi:hypothetical protein
MKKNDFVERETHTCIECEYFEYFIVIPNISTGICTKGHGYKEATAQGLPKPKKGQAYRQWYNIACEDFKVASEKETEEETK